MPETFDVRFPVSVYSLQWAACPHFSSALSKSKCLAAKNSCLNPLWTYFRVTCSRLDPDDGITARGCAWMSPEETVVVLIKEVVGCLYTDVTKTSISNFRRVGTAFPSELPQSSTVLLFGSYSGQIFSRRHLLTRRRKWYQVCTSYRLPCVIDSEMNYPASLKLHDATLTDQYGGVLKITTQYDTEPRIDWK